MATSSPSPPIHSLLASAFSSVSSALITLSTIGIGYYTLLLAYRRTLHPLASFPGPIFAAISHLPWWWHNISGDSVFWIKNLHEKYGSVVRYGPNDLSYIDAGDEPVGAAWHALQGQEKNRPEYPKAPEFLPLAPSGIEPITFAPYENHRRFRRVLAPAFAERYLRDRQHVFVRNADDLVKALRDMSRSGPVEMTSMYNFTTYDIMGDLCYSKTLGLLETRKYTAEVLMPFKFLQAVPFLQCIQYYPFSKWLYEVTEPRSAKKMKLDSFQYSIDRVHERVDKGTSEPDMWNFVLTADEGKGMSLQEQYTNTEIFFIAGSETTATLLSGLTYYLLGKPETMARLVAEIRGAFASDDEIDLQRLASLPYLEACLQEGLRIYPPVPIGIPRYVSEDHGPNNTVLGRRVPPGTRIMVSHYATYHNSKNFADPDEFAPQRWLSIQDGGEERFRNDRLGAVQAFSVGPRNCVGQNMARHEFRIILAKLLYNFDLELCDECKDWHKQKTWALWNKTDLMIRLKPVEREGEREA
jgi:cytochrome P450